MGRAPQLLFALGLRAAALCSANAEPSLSIDKVLEAIEQVESSGDPLTIRDNSGNRSVHPQSLVQAVAISKELLGYDHNIDIGAMQVNRIHFETTVRQLGFVWEQLFDPQIARQVARVIFSDIYARVASRLGLDNDVTLWRAVGCYNGGEKVYTYADNLPYQTRVMAQLGLRPLTTPPPVAAGSIAASVLARIARMWTKPWRIGQPLEEETNESADPGTAATPSHSHARDLLVDLALLALGSGLVLALAAGVGAGLLVRLLVTQFVIDTSRRAAHGIGDPV